MVRPLAVIQASTRMPSVCASRRGLNTTALAARCDGGPGGCALAGAGGTPAHSAGGALTMEDGCGCDVYDEGEEGECEAQ